MYIYFYPFLHNFGGYIFQGHTSQSNSGGHQAVNFQILSEQGAYLAYRQNRGTSGSQAIFSHVLRYLIVC